MNKKRNKAKTATLSVLISAVLMVASWKMMHIVESAEMCILFSMLTATFAALVPMAPIYILGKKG